MQRIVCHGTSKNREKSKFNKAVLELIDTNLCQFDCGKSCLIHSLFVLWDYSVLSQVNLVSCSRKKYVVLTGFELTTDQHFRARGTYWNTIVAFVILTVPLQCKILHFASDYHPKWNSV